MDRDAVRTEPLLENSELTRLQRHRAVRVIAASAIDSRDCRLLLNALGLRAEEGKVSTADALDRVA